MLRRREIIGWLALVLVIACPLALWGADRETPEPKIPLARVEVQAARIDWLPRGEYESLLLTVAGPEDLLYIRREFSAVEAPSFSSLDVPGGRLPDGVYAYELRAISRLPEQPLVQSGHLWVQGGSFVTNQSKSASKPPSIITDKTTISDDLIVEGHACIGSDCVDAAGPALKIKDFANYTIQFDGLNCCFPWERRWALQANEPGASGDFLIRDVTQGTIPFRIGSGVPDNAFTIWFNGNVGLGTLTPAVRLDVKASTAGQATERLQSTSATGYSGTEYLDNAGNVDLFFGVDNAASTTRLNSVNNNPIVVLTNSTERLRVTSAGDVGIGTSSPAAQVHIRDTGSRGKILAENASGTTTPREILELRNNGGSVAIFKDTSVAQRWGVGTFGSSFLIDNQANAGIEYTFSSSGNLTIAGTLTQGSDRDTKRDIVSVQPGEILAKLMTLPITTWNRKTDDPAERHLGPMAQDFAATFGLGGKDDRHIAVLDVGGVSLASIQALYRMVTEKDAEIEELRHRLAAIEALLLTAAKP